MAAACRDGGDASGGNMYREKSLTLNRQCWGTSPPSQSLVSPAVRTACPSTARCIATNRLCLEGERGRGQLEGQNLKSRGFGVLLVPARELPSPECAPSCQVTVLPGDSTSACARGRPSWGHCLMSQVKCTSKHLLPNRTRW